jgi:enamine deaminase RidA (YjgF/YER057c/UK114 family)
MSVEILNPEGLPTNPAYAQGTVASGQRIVVVGGQNGVTADGTMAHGVAAQTEQALSNVLTVLDAAGATPADVARLGIYLVESVDPREAYGAVGPVWREHPTAIVGIRVAGLGRPDALVEIEAFAVV